MLRKELASLENEHRSAVTQDTSSRPSVRAPAPGDHRITTYAWDQSDKFVKLYVTVADVQTLPEGSLSCTFGPDMLDLRVRGHDQKEKYLLVRPLFDEIDPAASSYSIKRFAFAAGAHQPLRHRLTPAVPFCTNAACSDRVFVKLCKKSPGSEWGSVDDSERREKERKEEKAKANQGKSTAQLLSELYGDADDDAKKKLEEAWEKGRAEREKKSKANS